MSTLYDVLRGRYRPSEGFVATHVASQRSNPGRGLPGASVTMLRGLNAKGEERFFILEAKELPCTLGMGCEDFGVCFALAHGEPDRCGA